MYGNLHCFGVFMIIFAVSFWVNNLVLSLSFALVANPQNKSGCNMRSSNDTLAWQQIYSCNVVRMLCFFLFCAAAPLGFLRNGRRKTCKQNSPVNSFSSLPCSGLFVVAVFCAPRVCKIICSRGCFVATVQRNKKFACNLMHTDYFDVASGSQ